MYVINQFCLAIFWKNAVSVPPPLLNKGLRNPPTVLANAPAVNNPKTLNINLAQVPTPEAICETSNNVNTPHNTETPIAPTPV